jgi:hypothetical protein
MAKGQFDHSVAIAAAAKDQLECLEYLHDERASCDARTTAAAAEAGSDQSLKYLLDKNCPVDDRTLDAAAAAGDEKCIKLLHDKEWSIRHTAALARQGHSKGLNFLLSKTVRICMTTAYACISRSVKYCCCYRLLLFGFSSLWHVAAPRQMCCPAHALIWDELVGVCSRKPK